MNRVVAIFLLVLFHALVLSVVPAIAAEQVGEWYSQEADTVVDSPDVHASGTVVAAALETAGYRVQQMVLQDLQDMLGSMSAFIFIFCAIGGLAMMVITNQYAIAIWLLIGPGLFNFMVYNTTDAGGAEWRYGVFEGDNTLVEQAVTEGDLSTSINSEVSWVFHEFNVFVSGVIQAMIKVVSNRNIKEQSLFMVRQRVMSELLETQVISPGLSSLIHFNAWTCSEELNAARIVALGKRDPEYRSTAEYRHAATLYYEQPFSVIQDAFNTIYAFESTLEQPDSGSVPANVAAARALLNSKSPRYATNKHQITHQGALNYLRELYETLRADWDAGQPGMPIVKAKQSTNITDKSHLFFNHDCLDVENFEILDDETSRNRMTFMTCEQIWCWMAAGVHIEIVKETQEAIDDVAKAKEQMTDQDHDNFLKQIYNDLAKKLAGPDKLLVSTNVPLLGQDGRTTEEKREEYAGANVEPDPSVIPIVIGGYMIKKAMQGDTVNMMREQLTHHTKSATHSHNFDLKREKDDKYSDDEMRYFYDEMLEHQYAAQEQGTWYAVALTLPYIQGIMLYALALLYPFFCLMVLIPGRASSFLGWMAFWVWVKSWDLGWAFVMIADTALWELMPHNSTFDPVRDPTNGPVTTFEKAFEGDHSYSLSTYYMLMGLMINGVPLVTARFILGAKMAMAGVLIDGVKAFGEKFGQQSADFIANEQANQLEFVRYANNYRHGIENIQKFSDMAFLDPKNAKDKDVLNKRLNEFMKQSGHMHKQGDALDALAKDLGTKGMIALSAAAATGMISVPALAFGSERYLNSVSGALGGSKTFHRMAHSMKAQLYEDNFKLQYYQFARGAAAEQLVSLQGASSKRGEYWNHPGFSQDSVKNLYVNPELARQQEMATKFQIMGDMVGKPKRR